MDVGELKQKRKAVLKEIDVLLKECNGCMRRKHERGVHTEHICLRHCETGKEIKFKGDILRRYVGDKGV